MLIGVNGYGYTGSGAVLDLLHEFDETQVLDQYEFQVIHEPDGIMDLEHHLVSNITRLGSNTAIKRFIQKIEYREKHPNRISSATKGKYCDISKEYINELTKVSWMGHSNYDPPSNSCYYRFLDKRIFHRIVRYMRKYLRVKVTFPPNDRRYFAVMEDEFYKLTKDYIKKLLIEMGADFESGKITVLNQLFPTYNPEKGFKFFENPKAIVVDRDPRDLYILLREVVRDKSRFMPSNSVEKFTEFYRMSHINTYNIKESEDILYVKFEDLIYSYEDTVEKIKLFTGINKHNNQYMHFKPKVSAINTQLYEKYDYRSEVSYIENELSEWLYDFDSIKLTKNKECNQVDCSPF